MFEKRYISKSPLETQKIAADLATKLKRGAVVALVGPLGAGKTMFVQGLAKGLKISDKFYVNSPTFTILNIYEGEVPLYHFDFYRLSNESEVLDLGIEEYLFSNGISVIEWAEKFPHLLPKERIWIELSFIDEKTREIAIIERS